MNCGGLLYPETALKAGIKRYTFYFPYLLGRVYNPSVKLLPENEYFLVLYPVSKCRCFVPDPVPMQLMMYIGNDLIEAIPLDRDKIPKPGYLGAIKRNLKLKYSDLVKQYTDPPEFLVITLTTQNSQNSSATRR
jgi:hypothetical protein